MRAGPWDDRIGPTIMVVTLGVCVIAVAYYEIRKSVGKLSSSTKIFLHESANCRKHQGELPGMFVTPSDVIVDPSSQRLLVVSKDTVFMETANQVRVKKV